MQMLDAHLKTWTLSLKLLMLTASRLPAPYKRRDGSSANVCVNIPVHHASEAPVWFIECAPWGPVIGVFPGHSGLRYSCVRVITCSCIM